MRRGLFLLLFVAVGMAGCKSSAEKNAEPAVVQAAPADYGEPPSFDAGMGVEQAYAAIPHRRTVWVESDAADIPAAEKAYLKAIFQVLDQAVAVRVASERDYANGRFDREDTDAEFDLLTKYVRGMAAPAKLAAYHKDILDGLTEIGRAHV